jgi:hypothetical protein
VSDIVVSVVEQRLSITDAGAAGVQVAVTESPLVVTEARSGPQGPPGPSSLGFQITVSDTEPDDPSVNDVWIQTS